MKRIVSLLFAIAALGTSTLTAQNDVVSNINQGIEKTALAVQPEDAATPPAWTKKGVIGVNMSQASFSNWSAGGDPSIAFDATSSYGADYKHGKHMWNSRIELAYGLNRTESNGTRKTNDKIYIASNYGYGIAKNLYLGALAAFETQFDKGYDYKVSSTVHISNFMAPGYLSAGLGLTWTPYPWMVITYSPASWRGTFVNDDSLSALGAFGVTPGEHFLNEFGSNLKAEVKKDLWTNISLYSRLELFSNYLNNPQNVDVKWDVQLNMKVTRFITANLLFSMIYDDDIKFARADGGSGPKIQIKEVLGVGLQFAF